VPRECAVLAGYRVRQKRFTRLRQPSKPVTWTAVRRRTRDHSAKRHYFTNATESQVCVIINRLTVDGKDYFLPDPVTELKNQILDAIKAGGGYVNIPPLRSGPGIDILFSPGMPVTWAQIEVNNETEDTSRSGDVTLDEL
jgi:hypothetical protein